MRKTQTVVIDVNYPRKTTHLQEIRDAVEPRTNLQGPTIIPGREAYCPVPYPPAPVWTIDDTDAILDDLLNQVGEVDNGEAIIYDGIGIQPVLFAEADRASPTSFTIPTHASYVVDVWFDWLHADPETTWQFTPDTEITTTEALDAAVLVHVLYVGLEQE